MLDCFRVNYEINQEILEKILQYPQLSNINKIDAIELIKSNNQNEVVVVYKILVDFERKKQGYDNIYFPLLIQLSSNLFTYKSSKSKLIKVPNNWVYGFRCCIKARILMERLFAALKDSSLEWRILDNFSIRVRPLNSERISRENNSKILRFDIKVFKVKNI